jgi:hypothetical protein
MSHKHWIGLIFSAALLVTAKVQAQTEVKYAEPKSDIQNFLGDRITYSTTLHVKSVKLGKNGTGMTGDVCVLPNADLRGIGAARIKVGDDEVPRVLFKVIWNPSDSKCEGEVAAVNSVVALDPDMLTAVPPNRRGWAYGTLLVPYKYQMKGDRTLAGSASLGGYIGYRNTLLGTSTQPIFFAGATKVDVPTTIDGKATSEQLAGLSYGVGLLTNFKQAFQVGLVIGVDRVSKSANYVNNGKPWISFSLGYAFEQ